MHLEFLDTDLMKDVCIVVQSLRNGYHQLVTHLGDWIVQRLQFVEDCPPESVLEVVWLTLGAEGLVYKAGRLQVSARHQDG